MFVDIQSRYSECCQMVKIMLSLLSDYLKKLNLTVKDCHEIVIYYISIYI